MWGDSLGARETPKVQISGFTRFSEHAYGKGESLKCIDRWAGRISQGLSFTAASSTYHTHSNLTQHQLPWMVGQTCFFFLKQPKATVG